MSKSELKEIYDWSKDESLPFGNFLLNYRGFEKGKQAFFFGLGVKKKKGIHVDWDGGVYDHFALIMVLKGKGTYIDHQGNKFELGPGSVFVRSTERSHELYIDPSSEWHEYFIAIKHIPLDKTEQTDFSREMIEIPQGKLWMQYQTAPSETEQVLKYIVNSSLEESVFQNGLDQKKMIAFFNLVSALSEAKENDVYALQDRYFNFIRMMCESNHLLPPQNNPLVKDIMSLLNAAIYSADSIPDLLSDLPASYSKIRRVFKQETGTSLGQYYLQLKMEEAIVLLKANTPLKEIAERLSYSDQFAFSSQFKKYTGVSPKNFLKKMVL